MVAQITPFISAITYVGCFFVSQTVFSANLNPQILLEGSELAAPKPLKLTYTDLRTPNIGLTLFQDCAITTTTTTTKSALGRESGQFFS